MNTHSFTSAPPDSLAGLNPAQREAAEYRGSPLLIVAGAGSGKTRVLTRRISHLLASGAATPSQILAITFTNKAAAEMRERVSELVGPSARHMLIATFHSACVRILRRHAHRLGLGRSFTIYDQQDSLRLIEMISRDLDIEMGRQTPKGVQRKISDAKNDLVDPDTYVSQEDADLVVAEVYREYQRRLFQANACDFDDLIGHTVALLHLFPDVAAEYQSRFRHILVDEYQDTNHAQYELVYALAGYAQDEPARDQFGQELAPAEVCVVGDADQSIYAFRGATIRNIDEFERDFPQAHVVLLEQNYRSTQNILTAANAVIAKNAVRRPKRLWSEAGAGAPIVGYVADDEAGEAGFVADEITRLRHEAGRQPKEIAVFYRTNAQSRSMEEALMRAAVPYRLVGAVKFYERKEIRDALAYLRALVNPDDDVSLRRIINTPRRGIGDKAQELIASVARRDHVSFGAALTKALADDDCVPGGLPARTRTMLQGFADLMQQLRADVEAGAVPTEILARLWEKTGITTTLAQSDDPQDGSRLENLVELHSVAKEFEQSLLAQADQLTGELVVDEGDFAGDIVENGDPEISPTAAFLEQVALVSAADELPDEHDQGQVTLMTLHTAKGLEYPVVFLTGMEEGIFPHLRAIDSPDELEEERRLAYVGITRAREQLYLCRSLVRTMWGQSQQNLASRFIQEIPAELIEWRRSESDAGSLWTRADSGATSWSSPAQAAPKASGLELRTGDRITHDTFGLGTVIATAGAGATLKATIDFGDGKPRTFAVDRSPIEKIGGS